MIKFLAFLFIISIHSIVSAATFIPLSLDKQLEDASGVLKGKFVGLSYRKMGENKIITEATFQIIESSGIKQRDIINKNNFKVIYPGGKWQNLDYRVSGTPTFKPNEVTLLVVKKSPIGFIVKGLAMGKYLIQESREETFYKSSVFPNHPALGKISIKQFNDSLVRSFGSPLVKVKTDKFVYVPNKDNRVVSGRAPASIRNNRTIASETLDDNEEKSSSSTFWLVILFAALGGYSALSIKKKHHRK
ncbi:hypothetical protein A9Q84_21475 [Halobacteriovorax marinus]|uniref:SURF1-like protein n=1 Tax=Halobacteriovorax marinus TaxID=97084 RepID=A0A1Y5F1S5_9BACT|nr:hypothetical protein A9Q84_21475 [Halobacteriovorax marinus]